MYKRQVQIEIIRDDRPDTARLTFTNGATSATVSPDGKQVALDVYKRQPLMCRITVDGEIKQFSCKMDVPPRLWDVKNSRASGKSVEAQKINLAVDKIRVEVNRRYQELMQTDGYVTAAKLKDAYLGIGVKQETLLKLFEQHNAEFEKKVGHSRAQGTFTRYRTAVSYTHLL